MECRACTEGSITSAGYCDLCGFNELQFIMEWEEWSDSLEADPNMEAYEQWASEMAEAA